MSRVFLLSPANAAGLRAQMVMRAGAAFDLARRLRGPGAPLAEVFSFVSGLYFRGKVTYARAFAAPPPGTEAIAHGGVLVIAPGAGLCPADLPVTLDTLRRFSRVEVDPAEPRYRRPLAEAAERLAAAVGDDCDVVLLGSIASRKYTEVLGAVFGPRLLFPAEFVGRGDMSRGGLLLRCAAAGEELAYLPVLGSVRHGPRPPRLGPPARLAATPSLTASGVPDSPLFERRLRRHRRVPGEAGRGASRPPSRS
jgi:hypothetical protein